MRVFAICQDELVIRSLDTVLLPSFEVDFLVESRPLVRRLHDAGIAASAGDPGASIPTSKPTSPPAPASSSKTTAAAA
jgi:hypothetical protein